MNTHSLDELYSGCGEETLPVKDGRKTGGRRQAALHRIAYRSSEALELLRSEQYTGLFIPGDGICAGAPVLHGFGGRFLYLHKGCKTAAVYLACDVKETVLSVIRRCEAFLSSVFEDEAYSYDAVARAYQLSGAVCLDLNGEAGKARSALLRLRIMTGDDGIAYACDYDSAAYSEYTVNGLIRTMDNIIGEFLMKERLGDVRVALEEDEKRNLNLYGASSLYDEKPAYRHLQDSALIYPDRTALIAIDRALTYRELNEEANALGHVLRTQGADIESRIAVLADRNSYGYVMRQGALKSGGAFMPIDPEYPEERIMYIPKDSECRHLVATREIIDRRKELFEALAENGIAVIDVEAAISEGERNDLNIEVPLLRKDVDERSIIKPATEIQEQLCAIYKKVLSIDEVGVNESFFELGGTSLSAARVHMMAIAKKIPINYQDIFDVPDILGLEKLINSRREYVGDSEEPLPGNKNASGEDVLSYNTTAHVGEIKRGEFGNVLLAGGNGFLGVHVLKCLLDSTEKKITCLVRGSRLDSYERLRNTVFYYFDTDLEVYKDRVRVVDGDIIDLDSLKSVEDEDFDIVFNCAASVKLFAVFDSLKRINVTGVENLARLCLKKKARLIHVSTVSVGGDLPEDHVGENTLRENNLDIGQEVESNAYVHTKYLAEKTLIKSMREDGLDAKIMRVGNLMGRSVDGEFQMNFGTNSFINTLRAYKALGCFPMSELDERDELSPVDETARAMCFSPALTGDSLSFMYSIPTPSKWGHCYTP